jgi:hypothetical protein
MKVKTQTLAVQYSTDNTIVNNRTVRDLVDCAVNTELEEQNENLIQNQSRNQFQNRNSFT